MAKVSKNIKKWFGEIIIVFLGITIAFFVENYRQDSEDKAIYKKHLQAIYKDLVQDSQRYESYISINEIRVVRIDSLCSLVLRYNGIREKILLAAYLQGFEFYESHDNAFSAFRNSESFTGMENSDLRDSLSAYYGGQSFIEFHHNEQYNWMKSELFKFLDQNLHQDDLKFDRYWHPAHNFGTWPDIQPKYRSNVNAFDDIVVLNYAKRCRDFVYYMAGSIQYGDVPYNLALRQNILRALNK